MKKTLVVLLILAVAGGVFAQDITWSGEVKTGIKVDLGDSQLDNAGDKVVNIQADEDDVPTGVKARLNAAVTGENYGLEFGIQANLFDNTSQSTTIDWGNLPGSGQTTITDDDNDEKALSFYNAHGWLDFVNGMIKVRAGLIDPKVWNTKGPKDWAVSQGLGFRLEVMPIEGLNVGAFLNYGEAYAGKMEIGQFMQETAFGFSYENADIMGLYANAAFKLDSDYVATGTGDSDDSTLTFGFGINPMEPLAIKVEGKIESLGAYSDKGWMWFIEDVSYMVMEPLKVGLRMDQQMANKDALGNVVSADKADFQGYEMYLEFKPYAEYAVNDSIKIGAEIPFALADNQDALGFAKIGATVWGQYNVAASAWIKASYGFTNKFEDYAPQYGSDSTLDHTIRLIACVAF